MSELLRRLRLFFQRDKLERELEEEMQSHLDMSAEANRENGMRPDEARYAAQRQFGNPTLLRETSREMWGWLLLERIGQDVRYALRMMEKSPVFAAVAIASLALGIGLNTSIFNIVNGVLLQSAPGVQPERLVALFNTGRSSGGLDGISTADYESYRDGAGGFEALAVSSSFSFSVGMGSITESVAGELVSDNYFSTLRVPLLVGRAFAPDSPGIVISYGFWQRRFGGDPAVIGKTLPVAGAAIPIVGVAPRNFRGLEAESLEPPNMWIPFSLHKLAAPAWIDYGRGMHWWEAVGRLKPGVTLAEAQAAVSGVSSRLAQEFPGTNREWRAKLVPLNEVLRIARSPLVNVLVVLSVVAGVVLLITCANLANLLLARGWRRSREMALRVSLGATRGRLLGQLLTESVLLAVFSGVVGWMLSVWTSGIQGRFYPLFRSGTEDATDARRLLFALVASVLTGILFGVAPAWQASRMDSYSTLKGEHSNRRGRYGMRNALITAQVSLSLLLLIGAGLFLTTLRNVRSSDVTFAARNVLLADIELVRQRYTVERAKHFWPQLLEAVRRLPGVNSTSLVLVTPHAGRRGGNNVIVGEQRVQVDYNMVASDYFQTIGIPLVRGRDFNDRDDAGAPPRVIVNEEFARRFWPGEDPIGKTFRMEYSNLVVEAVGVVRDGKFRGFRSTIQPCFYRPFNQETRSAPDLAYALTLEVRTAVEPHALVPTLRKAAARLDPDLPLKDVRTWQEHIARSMARETMLATLLSGLGLLAVLLASIGTYGVVSFAVAQRAREMGIRIALGASRAKILCDVIGGVLFPVSVGIVVGAAGAQALTRFVKSMLYGVSATDITVFSAVIAIELSVALTAAYLPARRATKIDPLEALRHE